MRPARIIAAVIFAAAVAATGSYLALSTAAHPSAAPQPPGTDSPVVPVPTTNPQPGPGPTTPPPTGRCDASALAGSVKGTEGAAGTIWWTIQLRNASARTCTVKGIPEVRLLGAQGQPVTAPSQPGGPGGSLVVLRPGQAARFAFGGPNACDNKVAGSRLRVTLPAGQGSLVVQLAGQAEFGTCASVRVQALQVPTTPATSPLADRISDPQVAADRLVAAWVRGDRVAARELTSRQVTDRLFSQSPPARTPVALPCRLADLGVFVCSYPVAERAELSIFVQGGASAGYGISGVEFGD
jgi:Domain of unknown function (DUF4232)